MTRALDSKFLSALILGLLLAVQGFVRAEPSTEDASVPALIKQLKEGDSDQKRIAVESLEKLGPEAAPAIPALRGALNDDSPYVSMGAAQALSKIGAAATPALMDTLKNENGAIRLTGAEALAAIGPDAKAAAPALARALADKDPSVRSHSAMALERIGSASAPALVQTLKMGTNQSRLSAIRVLGAIDASDENVINPLIDQLRNMDNQIVLAAVKAIGRKGSAAVPSLINALKSEDATLRRYAAEILGDIGFKADASVPALAETLKDPEAKVRASAAQALGKMGSRATSAVPALRVAAKDPNATVATRAAEALTSISDLFGNDAPAETEKKAPETTAVKETKKAPVAIPTPQPVPAKKKPAPAARKVTSKKGKALPPPPPPTPEELWAMAQSTDSVVQANAEKAIIQRSSETVPVLIPALKAGSTVSAEISAALLEKIGTADTKKVVEDYRKRLMDKKTLSLLKNLRQEGKTSDDAIAELVKIGAPIVKPVSDMLTDPKPVSRRAAAKVLNQLGTVAQPATAALIDATDDKDADVRKQAAEALAKIGTPEARKALRFFPIKDKVRSLIGRFIH